MKFKEISLRQFNPPIRNRTSAPIILLSIHAANLAANVKRSQPVADRNKNRARNLAGVSSMELRSTAAPSKFPLQTQHSRSIPRIGKVKDLQKIILQKVLFASNANIFSMPLVATEFTASISYSCRNQRDFSSPFLPWIQQPQASHAIYDQNLQMVKLPAI